MKGVFIGAITACVIILAFVAGTQFEDRNEGPVENMAESVDDAANQLKNEIGEAADAIRKEADDNEG